jgi:hypothetical protein
MERTDLRDGFFAEIHRDPFAHLISRICSDMWVEGYEQALRDVAQVLADEGMVRSAALVGDALHLKDRSSRQRDAMAWMTDRKHEAEAQMMIAMAATARLLREPRV